MELLTDWATVLQELSKHNGLMGGELTEGWEFVDPQPLTEDSVSRIRAFWADPYHYTKEFQEAKGPNAVDPSAIRALTTLGYIRNIACHWNIKIYVISDSGKEWLAQHRGN